MVFRFCCLITRETQRASLISQFNSYLETLEEVLLTRPFPPTEAKERELEEPMKRKAEEGAERRKELKKLEEAKREAEEEERKKNARTKRRKELDSVTEEERKKNPRTKRRKELDSVTKEENPTPKQEEAMVIEEETPKQATKVILKKAHPFRDPFKHIDEKETSTSRESKPQTEAMPSEEEIIKQEDIITTLLPKKDKPIIKDYDCDSLRQRFINEQREIDEYYKAVNYWAAKDWRTEDEKNRDERTQKYIHVAYIMRCNGDEIPDEDKFMTDDEYYNNLIEKYGSLVANKFPE